MKLAKIKEEEIEQYSCMWCNSTIEDEEAWYCNSCRNRYDEKCLLITKTGTMCPSCLDYCDTYNIEKRTMIINTRAGRKRTKLSESIRFKIMDRDDWTCRYCAEEATCIDHLTPYSHGGSDNTTNLVASCTICNLLASNYVFTTLQDKKEFILKRRKEKRIENKRRFSVCTDCMTVYPFGSANSTLFTCSICNTKDLN